MATLLGCLLFSGDAEGRRSKLRGLRRPGAGPPRPLEPAFRGTTFVFALDHAPFAGGKYDDPTVLVYVPAHYRLPEDGAVDVAVYFHGHRYTAERATLGQVLREQLDDSLANAVLVVPQLAVMAPDSSAGRLEEPRGLARLLREVVRELRRVDPALLGAASLAGARGLGTVCVAAHSGGYNAAAQCLAHGGVEVRECWLFDALYGQCEVFRDWLGAGRRKLVSFYAGGEVTRNNLALCDELRAAGVDCRHERRPGELSRADLIEGRAVFIAIPEDHAGAAFSQNQLRDCLRASALHAQGDGGWSANLHAPRKIDRRGGG